MPCTNRSFLLTHRRPLASSFESLFPPSSCVLPGPVLVPHHPTLLEVTPRGGICIRGISRGPEGITDAGERGRQAWGALGSVARMTRRMGCGTTVDWPSGRPGMGSARQRVHGRGEPALATLQHSASRGPPCGVRAGAQSRPPASCGLASTLAHADGGFLLVLSELACATCFQHILSSVPVFTVGGHLSLGITVALGPAGGDSDVGLS